MINVETKPAPVETQRLAHTLRPLSSLLGFAFAAWAQVELDRGMDPLRAFLVFLLAAALFAYGTWGMAFEPSARRELAATTETRLQPGWLAVALALGLIAFLSSAGNHFRIPGVLAWVLSVGFYLYALPHSLNWRATLETVGAWTSAGAVRLRWQYVLIGAITLLGAFFRFYRLDVLPAEMGPDLPLNYLNIQEILNGNYLVFFPSFPGREALFFYWAAIPAALFGNGHLTIKVAAALVGTLTIPVAFLVARRLFDASVGICAAAIVAVSHWHVILSRVGYRAILMPFFVLILAYLIAEALDTRRDWRFAFVGLWLGLGLYSYNSSLFAPLAFIVVILLYWLARRDTPLLALVRSVSITGLGAFLAWMPLARFIFDQPNAYNQRVLSRLTGAEQPLPADLAGTFLSNLVRTFGMFNVRGDSVFIVNVPGLREMGLITAVLFVLGVSYALLHARNSYYAIVLGLFVTMLMPSALALAFPVEVPSSDRASGGVVMALLLAALPLPLLGQQVFQSMPVIRGGPWMLPLGIVSGRRVRLRTYLQLGMQGVLWVAALVLFAGEARAAFQTVFVTYPQKQPAANYSISRELARALDEYAGNGTVYIEYWPHWFDGHAVAVQLTRASYDGIHFVDDLAARAPAIPAPGNALFLLHPEDTQALATLYKAFPRGSATRHSDDLGGVQFISFYVENRP